MEIFLQKFHYWNNQIINHKINIEKKLRNKIKEYEKEIKCLRENNYKLKEKENEYKYQYEKIIYEINNLKRDNKELISKIENYEEDINSLNQVNGKLEHKNKKYYFITKRKLK